MQNQNSQATASSEKPSTAPPTHVPDSPVREYIGSMAQELARMARWDGDEALAGILEAAMDRASTTVGSSEIEREPRP